MKANELMIGDWVHVKAHRGFNAQNIKVETIPDNDGDNEYGHHYGHIGAWLEGGDNDFRDVEAKHLQPIPLTNGILEKNFQEFLPGINLMYQLKGPYCIMNEDENRWVFGLVKVDGENSARYPLVKISFVHELQHALRLCGIDKTIEL